jgi:hypothetical protein
MGTKKGPWGLRFLNRYGGWRTLLAVGESSRVTSEFKAFGRVTETIFPSTAGCESFRVTSESIKAAVGIFGWAGGELFSHHAGAR